MFDAVAFEADLQAALERADARPKRDTPLRQNGKPFPSSPHTCVTCGARFERGEHVGLREHLTICDSYMNRVPVLDEHGNFLESLGDPKPEKLTRHIKFYGTEGAEPWLAL